MARRLSGGGAVYHDLGNLNFTFLVNKEDYDVTKQSSVILEDIVVGKVDTEEKEEQGSPEARKYQGAKFSGNAYYKSGNKHYHHGTIMIDVDLSLLSGLLTPSENKLKSKGVNSVKSRVVNLRDIKGDIDLDRVRTSMLSAFEKIYGIKGKPLEERDIDWTEVNRLKAKYESKEWKYDRLRKVNPPEDTEFLKVQGDKTVLKDHFPWGEIELRLQIWGGIPISCEAFTDSMDSELAEKVEAFVVGEESKLSDEIKKDIQTMLEVIG